MSSITRFIYDDRGADLIEYALLVGLISLAATLAITGVGTTVTGLFEKISANLNKALP